MAWRTWLSRAPAAPPADEHDHAERHDRCAERPQEDRRPKVWDRGVVGAVDADVDRLADVAGVRSLDAADAELALAEDRVASDLPAASAGGRLLDVLRVDRACAVADGRLARDARVLVGVLREAAVDQQAAERGNEQRKGGPKAALVPTNR
jgi:hypothetical protein